MNPDFSLRTTPTFLEGVYMITNAISDCITVICLGPCIYEQFVQTFCRHDYMQTLLTRDQKHRLAITFTDQLTSALGSEKALDQIIKKSVAELRKTSLIIVPETVRVALMGEDFSALIEHLSKELNIPIIYLKTGKITRDYYDAFSIFYTKLAETIPKPSTKNIKNDLSICVIGYLYERREGDHEGNINELKAMLAGIGLKPSTIWFSGNSYKDISKAQYADIIVSFHPAHNAAEIMSKKLNAKLLKTDLPVGISGSSEWLRKIAATIGEKTETEAEIYIKNRLSDIVPRIDKVVTRRLAGKNAAIIADRNWLNPLSVFFEEELGIKSILKIIRNRFGKNELDGMVSKITRYYDPSVESIKYHIEHALLNGNIDLIIGNAWEHNIVKQTFPDIPFFEFGYPCFERHYLNPTPFLGFTGAVTWAEQLANLLT